MELSSRRESLVQRRAAADATGSGSHGDGQKALEPKANGSGGGMLDSLGPVGPPLSFFPGEPPKLADEPQGAENRGETKG
jgi:hypothetical protein